MWSKANYPITSIGQQVSYRLFTCRRYPASDYSSILVTGYILINRLNSPPIYFSLLYRVGVTQHFRRGSDACLDLKHPVFHQGHHPLFNCLSSQLIICGTT